MSIFIRHGPFHACTDKFMHRVFVHLAKEGIAVIQGVDFVGIMSIFLNSPVGCTYAVAILYRPVIGMIIALVSLIESDM